MRLLKDGFWIAMVAWLLLVVMVYSLGWIAPQLGRAHLLFLFGKARIECLLKIALGLANKSPLQCLMSQWASVKIWRLVFCYL
jgi:hypothetical protein